jgi:hypothetical protein
LPYVGNIPAEKYASFEVQHFTTSATTGYTLTHAVANENDIRLVINNVIQQPGSGKAYVASGTTLTLSSATSGTDTMYCVFLGKAVQTVVPPAGSVTGSTLADDVISAQSALGAEPADTDEFLVSDAGVLKRVDYSYIKASTTDEFRPNAQPIIINGDMGIWQRSGSTVTMSDGYYNVDRFRGEEDTDGTATWSRSTSVPDNTGLPYSLQVDCTGIDSSIGASQQINIQQTIEAYNLQLLKWGTSDAEAVTLAFWVKSNQTGQHSVSFRKLDNTDYNQPKTYNIDVADTWEKKVLVFSALTSSGGEIDNNNGDGLQLFWKLAAGTSYQGTADTWTATNQGATAVAGDVNFMSSTSNNFFLTGVQIEVGSYTAATLPPFQHETHEDNLSRCQRYYYKIGAASGGYYGSGNIDGSNDAQILVPFSVTMRTSPSAIETNGTAAHYAIRTTFNTTCDAVPVFSNTDLDKAMVIFKKSAHGITNGAAAFGRSENNTSYLAWSAEL